MEQQKPNTTSKEAGGVGVGRWAGERRQWRYSELAFVEYLLYFWHHAWLWFLIHNSTALIDHCIKESCWRSGAGQPMLAAFLPKFRQTILNQETCDFCFRYSRIDGSSIKDFLPLVIASWILATTKEPSEFCVSSREQWATRYFRTHLLLYFPWNNSPWMESKKY